MTDAHINQLIKDYTRIDDAISELSNQAKDLRKQRTEYEEQIKEYLVKNDMKGLKFGSSTIEISRHVVQKKPKKLEIIDAIKSSMGEQTADKIINKIFENESEQPEVIKLKRKKEKVKK